MDDTRLLELAGKAAGEQYDAQNNPLERDDLALRLAVKVGMETYHADDDGMFVYASHPSARGIAYAIEPHGADPCAATRRAIVRAAAEIGKQHD